MDHKFLLLFEIMRGNERKEKVEIDVASVEIRTCGVQFATNKNSRAYLMRRYD